MTTKDDSIEWVVERLQALQQEHEEARRANRVVDHAACRIASESYLQDLLRAYDRLDEARAEVMRLQAEVERLKAEIQPRIDRSIAFQDAMEEAEAERDEARAEVMRLREIRQRGCDCNDEDACRFAMERDDAYRRGQEKMRRRASSLFAATDDADCYWRDEDIVEAIEALEVEP